MLLIINILTLYRLVFITPYFKIRYLLDFIKVNGIKSINYLISFGENYQLYLNNWKIRNFFNDLFEHHIL
jgi:hypothetical protein